MAPLFRRTSAAANVPARTARLRAKSERSGDCSRSALERKEEVLLQVFNFDVAGLAHAVGVGFHGDAGVLVGGADEQ